MVPELSQGSRNKYVRVAKYLTGFNENGKADNIYGPAFAAYMKVWKVQRGGKSTDLIGKQTWQLIAQYAAAPSKKLKAQTRALRIALGWSESESYTTDLVKIIKAIQTGNGIKANGVCGPETWAVILKLNSARNEHCDPYYKQTEEPWASMVYSYNGKANGQTIRTSGCGPTSMASVVATLTGDKTVTPKTMCDIAVAQGYRRKTGGTDPEFFPYVAKLYGLGCVRTGYTTVFKHCIDSGGIVICRFKAGSDWTSCGHYSPCWKYDSSYYYVDNTWVTKDPGRIKGKMSKITSDCVEFICIYPK